MDVKCSSQLSLALKQLGLALKQLGLALKQLGLALKQLGLALIQLSVALRQLSLALKQLGLALKQLGLALKQLGLALRQLSLALNQLALCSELCRSNRGICTRPGLCTCRHGWYGEHCDKCRTTPGCVHGTCHLPGQCICHKGWAGPLCDVESRYCLEHSPCLNGGTCHHDSSHNYTCSCPRGYVGAHCEVSECHSNFCLHSGTCLIAEGTRYCLCSSHYTGPRCQHKMDNILSSHVSCDTPPCSSPQRAPPCSGENCRIEVSAELVDMALTQHENPCLRHICYNGGRCSMGKNISAPACRCPAPFGGPHCLQVTKSSCRNNPCMNGGECRATKNMGAFQCICTPGFTGKLCQKVIQAGTTLCGGGDMNSGTKPSGVISCHNGGQCEKSPRGRNYYCKCPANFTGEFCELEKKDPCSRHQCLSGGICSVHASNGTAACICPTGYSGAVCENRQLFSACNRIQCHHGGACVDLPHNNFQCVCRGRYEGKYCERETRHGGMVIEIRTDCCNSRGESRCHSQSLLMLYLLTLSLLRLFIS
uniref:EGF-like domain-containing protein n=1 Tax=Biomphalaria glabrata TaxID=6526 RepID=A0A2C9JII0_BIOGL